MHVNSSCILLNVWGSRDRITCAATQTTGSAAAGLVHRVHEECPSCLCFEYHHHVTACPEFNTEGTYLP